MCAPVTIVLVNNGGGGIFDFLPIADEIPRDVFTQLWTTPQTVDLAGQAPKVPESSPVAAWLFHLCGSGQKRCTRFRMSKNR